MISDLEQNLREMNAALLVSSVHQHELTEQAEQAEIALRESESRYRTLFNLGPVALYSCNTAGVIQKFNRRAAELWGREPAPGDASIRYCGSFKMFRADGSYMPHDECPMADVVRGKLSEVRNQEVLVERPDGSRATVIINIRQLTSADGQILGAINSFYDISDRKQLETALRGSEIRYRRLFEEAKDGILILDIHSGRISDANPFMCDLLGYSHGEFLAKELWEIGLFSDKAANEAAFLELLERGYIRYENLPLETKHGRQVEVEVVANVYRENGHEVIQCNVRDITERHKTEQAITKALAYGNDIIATLREPFLVLDSDLRVRTANRSFYDSFRVSKQETEDRFVYDLGNGQWNIPGLRTLLDQVLTRNQSVSDFEVEHSFPTLGPKTMLLNARPFPPDSKNPELILLAVYDISAARQQANELVEAARHKDEFLATLAHELRNPLAPIRNAVQFLDLAGMGGPEARTAKEVIARQVNVMVRLVDDLLDVSRISRNKLDLRKQRVDLAGIMENAVESSRPLIEQCGHELTVDLPPRSIALDADPVRLAQVFSNLLNNAAKYTKRGGHIWLAARREGNDVVVSVRDNGTGISTEMLARIFDMFTQVDRSLDQSQGGLGIGLTLARRLVEMHDGTIEAYSPGVDQGSEFLVRLPLPVQPQHEPQRPSGAPRANALSGYRILVVDDNKDSADSLAMVLRRKANEIRTAYDGLEAVKAAEDFRPELVLLDIGLPKLNGYEVARRIRQQPWGQEVIIVALTGWGQDEDRRRSHEAGFDLHIVKPVELAALENLLAGR